MRKIISGPIGDQFEKALDICERGVQSSTLEQALHLPKVSISEKQKIRANSEVIRR
jgi:hypothetical protein